jgi:hypothetical protein
MRVLNGYTRTAEDPSVWDCLQAEGGADEQPAGRSDQGRGGVGIEAAVANGIGVGECVARYLRMNPQMAELGLLRAQAGFDVAQALPIVSWASAMHRNWSRQENDFTFRSPA